MKSGTTIPEVFALKFEKVRNQQRAAAWALVVAARRWRLSSSGLEAGQVRFYRLRQDPVPWVRRAKNGRLSRRPKTGNERRAHFSSEAAQEVLETHGIDLKERRKRNPRRLPNSWGRYLSLPHPKLEKVPWNPAKERGQHRPPNPQLSVLYLRGTQSVRSFRPYCFLNRH
jgi:hypothetical protein